MHYQCKPHEEVKVVRCLLGEIFDVIVDIRTDSETCGKYVACKLNGRNHRAVYIPKGFAHGFVTLTDNTLILYQMSESYSPGSGRTIHYNDPDINIAWPDQIGGTSLFRTMIDVPLSGVMFRKNRVLVAGATGLIGTYATRQLIDMGFDVLAASRSGSGPSGVRLNVHDADSVRELISTERPEYLLHLAWQVNSGYAVSPENLDWVVSSLNLLQIFAENGGRRAVFTGSCMEYDWSGGTLSEDTTPLEPDTLYGVAKSSLYRLASTWAEQINLSFAWGRVFFLYGIGERSERIMPYIIDSFLKGEKPVLKYPYISRDYLHAADMAGGLIALMLSDFNGAVNIASGGAVPLCWVAKKIAALMGCPTPEYSRTIEKDMASLVLADTRRLNNIIGFSPGVSWEKGLSEVINWRKNLLNM